MKKLVIVESPSKSQTIEKYLGPDYKVVSSKGHIRDLTTRGYGGFGIDIENDFTPMYKMLMDKAQVIRELKKEVKSADEVLLATDPDREGEAISWHLYEVLNLSKKPYERIVFHEITKPAILSAINKGRSIDIDLVHSQESRRIYDRIIGFSLSKLLQRKIGSKSAGRVQSVVLKIIVDREREIEAFKPDEYWEIFLSFSKGNKKLSAKLVSYKDEKIKLTNKEETDKVLSELVNDYVVSDIINKTREKAPKPPYITSTLQQDASTKFNFNAKKTMMIAQKLYEGIELSQERVGLITYMRTDSVRLSEEFINDGKDYITSEYGSEYYKGYVETNKKGQNVQDAHEAIRPTNIERTPEAMKEFLSADELKLYTLIYNRALSSLMSSAVIEDEKIKINNNGYNFEVSGEKIIFDGYLKVFNDTESTKMLPAFKVNEIIKNPIIESEQKFTNPPLRYSEARLIGRMKELGIGRPSTYAMTIETLKRRNYVKLEKKFFIPTKQGILTSDSLDKFFSQIINVKYTADMETILDEISDGKDDWKKEVKKFYYEFMPLVSYADEHMEKIYPVYLEEKCPLCGSSLVMRNGRYGEFAACSGFPKCRYIKKEAKEEDVLTDVKCPNCETGYLVERVCKRGRMKDQKFYACNQYPKCKTTFSTLPNSDE